MKKTIVSFGLATMAISAMAAVSVLKKIQPAWQPQQVVVFGDANSYIGNNKTLRAQNIPVSPPYWQGRFSNGPVWPTDLINNLSLAPNALADYATPYATILWRDKPVKKATLTLDQQVDKYVAANRPNAKNTLAVFWIGANDMQTPVCIDKPFRCVNAMIQDMNTDLLRVYQQGVRHFMVVASANIALTPHIKETKKPLVQKQIASLVAFYNRNLNRFAYMFTYYHKAARTLFFDYPTFAKQALANLSVQNNTPCLAGGQPCQDPSRYYFWDNFYPTAQVQHAFSEVMAAMLYHRTWFGDPGLAPVKEAPLPPSDSGDHYTVAQKQDKKITNHKN